MFKELLRGLLAGIAVKLLNHYRHLSVQLLKIEATKAYLRGVQLARQSALGVLGMGLMIGLICVGLVLIHAALFILLPWTLQAKAILGLGLGLVYVILGGVVLRAAMDEGVWMDKSGATAMLKEATAATAKD
ncbi:MAG: hypothetical protein NTY53_17475 [Kiritimatiellaeota bacterium]|nr:hypothetical protein [Kiritimatiellota bacterium]